MKTPDADSRPTAGPSPAQSRRKAAPGLRARLRSVFRLLRRSPYKLKSSTRLALLFTALMFAATLALYALFVNFFTDQFWSFVASSGDTALEAAFNEPEIRASAVFMLIPVLLAAAFVSFFLSSLIIDRTLNPLREMTEKLRSIAGRDYSTKIFIDSAEDELREYAVAFNHMTDKVNEHVERQKRFISDASHELVTPVAVIAGHSDMLLRWGKEDPALLASSLDTIRREAFAMNGLIENLLFFARTDSGRQRYDMRRLDLAALAADCLGEQRLLHPDFRIEFGAGGSGAGAAGASNSPADGAAGAGGSAAGGAASAGGSAAGAAGASNSPAGGAAGAGNSPAGGAAGAGGSVAGGTTGAGGSAAGAGNPPAGGAPIFVRADEDALRRVLRILFDNAVKYSAETKEICLSLETAAGSACLRVSDRGVGMERAHLEKIFDRFYRADDSRTRESGGSGLGLAIAKEIVSAHGGDIRAESAPGAGTAVTIRLRLLSPARG